MNNNKNNSSKSDKISSSVSRTAIDALNAKLSVLQIYDDCIPKNDENQIYKKTLQMIGTTYNNNNDINKSASQTNQNQPSPFKNKKMKRQSPLVNAGYAARMELVSDSLEQILSYLMSSSSSSTTTKSDEINLILLGGGLDALGIWAVSLIAEDTQKQLNVLELDCLDNFMLKKDALVSTGILKRDENFQINTEVNNNINNNTIIEGSIDLSAVLNNNEERQSEESAATHNTSKHKNNNLNNKYTLMSINLNNLSQIKQKLTDNNNNNNNSQALIDWSKPTIILSELVFAYLGRKASDDLLSLILSFSSKDSQVFLIAYEPTGELIMDNNNNDNDCDSLFDGENTPCYLSYNQNYSSLFSTKLNRGSSIASNKILFEPFGDNCNEIQHRLSSQGIGFRNVISLPAGIALSTSSQKNSCLMNLNKQYTEIFDEHSALTFHLLNYCITLASTTTPPRDKHNINNNNKMTLQSWFESLAVERGARLHHEECNYRPIVSIEEEEQVRQIFQNTYTPYANKNSSIRKMLKSSIKKNLTSSADNTRNKNNNNNLTIKKDVDDESLLSSSKSNIRIRYRDLWGGDFWVATTTSSPKSLSSIDLTKDCSTVAGFVGLKALPDEYNLRNNTQNTSTNNDNIEIIKSYEMQHFCVDQTYRRFGIGKELLRQVETFCKEQLLAQVQAQALKQSNSTEDEKNNGSVVHAVRLVADTINILKEANDFYIKNGFVKVKEYSHLDLIFYTYEKIIKVPN